MAQKPVQEYQPKDKAERLALLKKSAREINKDHGLDTLHFGNEHRNIEKLPVGFEAIDNFLGGGIPYGNFFTLWGPSGVGKSTIAHMLTASAQKQGKLVYYIALEPYDQARAAQFGVNGDELLIGQFPQAEQSLDTIVEFARKKLVDVIILDSIHSLSPRGEQEDKKGSKSLATDTMALLARKLSQFFKVAVDPVKRANIAVFMIGQTRTDLGGFIPIQKLSGGAALLHYSKGIIHIRKGQGKNAPSDKVATGSLTKSGAKSYETIVNGFECVLKVDTCQIDGMSKELSELRLPYYFESGFYIPEKLQKEIDIEEREIAEQNKESDIKKEVEPQTAEPKKKRGRPKKGI